jgi:hypothetical protein
MPPGVKRLVRSRWRYSSRLVGLTGNPEAIVETFYEQVTDVNDCSLAVKEE